MVCDCVGARQCRHQKIDGLLAGGGGGGGAGGIEGWGGGTMWHTQRPAPRGSRVRSCILHPSPGQNEYADPWDAPGQYNGAL